MAVYKIARYEVRPDARLDAERAMHDFATYVRGALPDSTWTTYRDPHAPAHYISFSRADDAAADERQRNAPGMKTFAAALEPLLAGAVEVREYELVTSSDLQRRHRRR